ncbi:S-layer homology domain-containing protein [Paenibacillus yanchengensis]|uniref:S-layer homology domain-containing protein n=1 Tax=Paenibacillus yanchengensis TaxID=2035833 RepID=A0ABW4YPV0_9BACL
MKHWKQKLLKRVGILSLSLSLLTSYIPFIQDNQAQAYQVAAGTGYTFMTNQDNWGGGAVDSQPDNDLKVEIKNGDGNYPIEFKINVTALPEQSAALVIRAHDIDAYSMLGRTSLKEWIRAYLSTDPADIVLRKGTLNYPNAPSTSSKYKQEMAASAYRGSLLGENDIWSTTVMPFRGDQLTDIKLGDNYVGLTVHDYITSKDINTIWAVKINWGQIVLDGGAQEKAVISDIELHVEKGQLTVTPTTDIKVDDKYVLEVNVVEEQLDPNKSLDSYVSREQLGAVTSIVDKDGKSSPLKIKESSINPDKNYIVNIILSEYLEKNDENTKMAPGKIEHLITLSTHDIVVHEVNKQVIASGDVVFTKEEFQAGFRTVINTPMGEQLSKVKLRSLPDATIGQLQLAGVAVVLDQEIPVEQLSDLSFVPVDELLNNRISFTWDGADEKGYTGNPAIFVVEGIPLVTDQVEVVEEGQSTVTITGAGQYAGSDDGISFASFDRLPSNGTIKDDGMNGLEFVYTPNSNFKSGIDEFSYRVQHTNGGISEPVTVTIHMEKALNGWVGTKAEFDPTIVELKAGEVLQLQANSSHLSEGVSAEVDGVEIPLQVTNATTWETDGFKSWAADYTLPKLMKPGSYDVKFTVTGAGTAFSKVELNTSDNQFAIAKAPIYPPYIPQAVLPTVAIELARKQVMAGDTSKLVITYSNDSQRIMDEGTLSMTIPSGVKVVNAAGAKQVDGKLIWTTAELAANASEQITVTVEWLAAEQTEQKVEIITTYAANSKSVDAKVQVTVNKLKDADKPDEAEQTEQTKQTEFSESPYMTMPETGMFYPSRTLTRAELAVMVSRLVVQSATTNENRAAFQDVSDEHWAASSIQSATAQGYFTKTNHFRPNEAVTRAELATIIVRMLQLGGEDVSGQADFTDMDNHWARTAIAILSSKQLIAGYDDDTFRPDRKVNRAEAVIMLNRMLGRTAVTNEAAIFKDVPATHWAFGHIQVAAMK